MTELVSIIIPAYNVSCHLKKCIESVTTQSYSNIEIVIVNDGSKDNSLDIITECAKVDNRIKFITIENSGVTKARKTGFELSKGELIMFVDGDDTLPVNAVEILASNINNDSIDIVVGNASEINGAIKTNLDYLVCMTSGQGYIDLIVRDMIKGSPWGRIYRRKLFDEHCFDFDRSIVYKEDILMNLVVAKKVNSISIIDDVVYNYFIHNESTVRTFKKSAGYEIRYFSFVESIISKESNSINDAYSTTLSNLCSIVLKSKSLNDAKMLIEFYDRKGLTALLSFKKNLFLKFCKFLTLIW
jgi:glycosyltransferase involved in cell wall biosynthesis